MVNDVALNEIYRELMVLASAESHFPYVYKTSPSSTQAETKKLAQLRHLRLTEAAYSGNEFETNVITLIMRKKISVA